MISREASWADIRHVMTHLGEPARREIAALGLPDDPCRLIDAYARASFTRPNRTTLAVAADPVGFPPACLLSIDVVREGGRAVANVGFAHSDLWPAYMPALYRWLKRFFIPALLVPHHAVARVCVLGSYPRAWLYRLGMVDHGRPFRRGDAWMQHLVWRNPNLETADVL